MICFELPEGPMKQFLFEISQPGQIELELSKVQNLCRTEAHTSVLAHVYYGNSDLSLIPELTRQIRQVLPDVQIAGTTSSGEVYHGHLMDQGILIAISVFATTRVQVRIYDCTISVLFRIQWQQRCWHL